MFQLACVDGGLCILAFLGISGLFSYFGRRFCLKKQCEN